MRALQVVAILAYVSALPASSYKCVSPAQVLAQPAIMLVKAEIVSVKLAEMLQSKPTDRSVGIGLVNDRRQLYARSPYFVRFKYTMTIRVLESRKSPFTPGRLVKVSHDISGRTEPVFRKGEQYILYLKKIEGERPSASPPFSGCGAQTIKLPSTSLWYTP